MVYWVAVTDTTHKAITVANWLTLAGLALLAILLPPLLTTYWQSVFVLFFISAISLVGYRFITLMGGWSFAHVAIMGLGAYAMALLLTVFGPWAFWPSLIVGPLIAGAFAMLIAFPVLRTRQYYFFLSTFAAGEALRADASSNSPPSQAGPTALHSYPGPPTL